MTPEDRRRLLICAEQADAHGHPEVARWYRCWAERGEPIGEKPEAEQRQGLGYGAPVC